MSTLEYLDEGGSVKNFGMVPWRTLHDWLSVINGKSMRTLKAYLPKGVNRGKVLEELEARRQGTKDSLFRGVLRIANIDRGYGKDWRQYECEDGWGLTHLEELLVFQPKDWRKQAREYMFRFQCDLARESSKEATRTTTFERHGLSFPLFLKSPILVVLFHPDLSRTSRYEPLNFLLSYGVLDPLPAVLTALPEAQQKILKEDLSPLDYFLEFQNYVSGYRLDLLRKIGKDASLSRLCLIKELDFADIVGQRMAKQMIRQSVVSHVWNRNEHSKGLHIKRHPLSMIFAGPSGNGKTELAHWLAKLLNKPSDDFFIKVDCGKLTHATEIFGLSGAYQGAQQGSALNNFVLRMSMEPQAVGIVLLDEIEKAGRDVIHALYQVIDKGEWTNKRLTSHGSQTDVIDCSHLIFIMTTNACDDEISDFVKRQPDVYNLVAEEFDDLGSELAASIRTRLQYTPPFTEAFLGRIGRIVPFLPMARGDPNVDGILHGEGITVTKMLIERQQEKLSETDTGEVKQAMSASTKNRIAKIVIKEAIPESGVRGLQSLVEQKMGDRIINALLLEKGGIEEGSHLEYFAREEAQLVEFRVVALTGSREEDIDHGQDHCEEDLDLFE